MIEVPEEALEERFLASTGPGGQNVNSVCQGSATLLVADLAP